MISLLDTVAGDNATKFQLGLIIKKDTIIGVKWDSPCLGLLQSGDILHSINKEIFSDEPGKNREVLSKMIQSGGKFTINVIRFKRRPTMKPIIPKGYECMEGYEYEWTMLYLMRGMTLGLDVRLIDGKLSLTQRNVREDGSKKLEEPTAGLWFFRFPGRAVRLYTITFAVPFDPVNTLSYSDLNIQEGKPTVSWVVSCEYYVFKLFFHQVEAFVHFGLGSTNDEAIVDVTTVERRTTF
ncbi:hypothetical protein Y032_0213g2289 [Ancylostoma ceylanicum]|uniref:PDZ domain-containing protein n=1 Tax=Ancylostoma ceylanicum TaxID=53326 RepID=A0A016SJH1_9BILA|nr:hypothetical protein Y032_0213g2289 [Ancylostoma ceylanicum]